MNIKFNILILAFCLGIHVNAQEQLSFDAALQQTLANNYDIQLAAIDEEVAINNASLANNGYLPSLNGSGNYNWNYYEGKNKLATETRTFEANSAYTFGASVTASYRLFEGMGRRYRYKQSQESLKLTQLQVEQIIQNTILELSNLYYEVARLVESNQALATAVEISQQRLKRLGYEYDYGQVNQLEVLNAKVDLNNDSIALVNGIQSLETTKRNLNYVMGRDVEQELSVDQKVDIRYGITKEEVLAATESQNLDLQLAKSNLQINQYAIGQAKSAWLPSIDANAGYNFSGNENPNSPFLVGSQTSGPQAGVSLSWSLFNGQNNVAVKNAKLGLKSQQISQAAMEQNIRSQALNAFTAYQNALFVLRSQSDNIATAEDNFNRSKETYERGQIDAITFRQAQLNLLNAQQALSQAKYAAKNAELQLLAVMGELVE
tara:strand:- start:1850 stop:3151 length:1302 start_codon:yes stop_codon:yes gene_type:complete